MTLPCINCGATVCKHAYCAACRHVDCTLCKLDRVVTQKEVMSDDIIKPITSEAMQNWRAPRTEAGPAFHFIPAPPVIEVDVVQFIDTNLVSLNGQVVSTLERILEQVGDGPGHIISVTQFERDGRFYAVIYWRAK